MTNEIKAGDVVQLKSGGPRMTVADVDGDRVSVIWFATDEATETSMTILKAHVLTEWLPPSPNQQSPSPYSPYGAIYDPFPTIRHN